MNEMWARCTPGRAGVLVALCIICITGCAGSHVLTGEDEAHAVIGRLNERRDSIQSAVYRVRWRAVGVEPHSEFILEIAYQEPERYRIVATGPFGIPAFTAVVIDDGFTFINHHDGRFIDDALGHLIEYDFPVAEFFEGPWRDLFGGGWGGSREVQRLERRGASSRFAAQSPRTSWELDWNRKKRAPKKIIALVDTDEGGLSAQIWFDQFDAKKPPFWELDRLVLKGVNGKGEHQWKVLRQSYNILVPDRFFEPLKAPPEWERNRH